MKNMEITITEKKFYRLVEMLVGNLSKDKEFNDGDSKFEDRDGSLYLVDVSNADEEFIGRWKNIKEKPEKKLHPMDSENLFGD
jgi:hypothetical protein